MIEHIFASAAWHWTKFYSPKCFYAENWLAGWAGPKRRLYMRYPLPNLWVFTAVEDVHEADSCQSPHGKTGKKTTREKGLLVSRGTYSNPQQVAGQL